MARKPVVSRTIKSTIVTAKVYNVPTDKVETQSISLAGTFSSRSLARAAGSWNVYSLEELCYYIENNTYLLEKDFMTEELCTWVGKEIKNEKLCK